MPDVDDVHDGYFATTAKGVPKDIDVRARTPRTPQTRSSGSCGTRRSCSSFDEPLRFIFSHSALAEGWDNPNVFTICNLQDGRSDDAQAPADRPRPAAAGDGERRALPRRRHQPAHRHRQRGVRDVRRRPPEGDRGGDRRRASPAGSSTCKKDKIKLQLKEEVLERPDLRRALGAGSRRKTTYQLDVRDRRRRRRGRRADQRDGPARAGQVPRRQDTWSRSAPTGVGGGEHARPRRRSSVEGARKIPDVVGELCRRVPLSRATIVRILKAVRPTSMR